MVKARKYVVKKHFHGMPKKNDFELVVSDLPALNDGEILVKAEYISVDPYLRAYNSILEVPYDQFGYQVGIVLESKHPEYSISDRVVTHEGWQDYLVVNPEAPIRDPGGPIYKLPNLKGFSPSLGVGAIGMPGVTAYFGLLELCEPKAGETVVVSGAAGAVGSLVGQIAKIKGCRVIGFAGTDLKVKWLEEELGFDKAFNYKKVNTSVALKEAAPNGVDCYFDNVGGKLSNDVIRQMNFHGRVSICGSISSYNDTQLAESTIVQPIIALKQLKYEEFLVWRWSDRWMEALTQLIDWILSGQLKVREHVTEGFDNLYDALVGMMNGDNIGKALVKV